MSHMEMQKVKESQQTLRRKTEGRGLNLLTSNIYHKHKMIKSLGDWGKDKPGKQCSSSGDSEVQKHKVGASVFSEVRVVHRLSMEKTPTWPITREAQDKFQAGFHSKYER